jgi:hypothetical protein
LHLSHVLENARDRGRRVFAEQGYCALGIHLNDDLTVREPRGQAIEGKVLPRHAGWQPLMIEASAEHGWSAHSLPLGQWTCDLNTEQDEHWHRTLTLAAYARPLAQRSHDVRAGLRGAA